MDDQQSREAKKPAIYRVYNLKDKIKLNKKSIVPLAAAALFGITVCYWNSQNYALALECNGRVIAAVENDAVYEQANHMIMGQLAPNSKAAAEVVQTEVKLASVSKKECCASPNEVRNKIIEQSNETIVEGAGIYVNGKLVGIGENEEEINAILSKMLEDAKGEEEFETEFAEKVEVVKGLFASEDIQEIEDIESLLVLGEEKITEYEVIEGDTIVGIADKLGVSTDELFEMNNSEQDICFGDKLMLKSTVKIVNIKICKIETEEREIPFTTVTEEDSSKDTDWKKVTQKGQNGLETVKSKVFYVDGKEQGRENLERQTINEPIEERVTVGTQKKEIESQDSSGNVEYNNKSSLRWPMPYTKKVTSGFGRRGREFHKGIDISSRGIGGQPIVAAGDGVVEIACYNGGYGNCVKISHAGGLKTLYGHCAKLCVSQGQTVSAGQTIGTVGNTGWSDGKHLHFEVHHNGAVQNPRNYV